MKNELQIQNEIKDKIMLHTKALIKPLLFQKGFDYLVSRFFDNLETESLDDIDKFQIVQAIFLSLQAGLLEEEDFENLSTIKRIYKILYHRILQQNDSVYLLQTLYESNNFYCQKLEEILKQK